MRIVVTGSDGFVGSHAVELLTAQGHAILPIDIKSGRDAATLGTRDLIEEWDPDCIVHLAATCSTPGSLERPMETFHNTVATTAQMCEAARSRKVPFILTSSVKARDGRTPYGAAKRMSEIWACEYRDSFGMPLIINRPGTIYGPGQEGSEESGWIAWFMRAQHLGLGVTINGSGEQVRDLLHVSDYIRLLATQVDYFDRYEGGLFDVGGGEANAVSVNQMAAHLGLDVTHGPARTGDADRYVGENGVPGWEPRVRWTDAIP